MLEELWTRFIAGELLGAAERTTLAAALERDEVFRRRLVHDLQLDGVLRAAAEIERGDDGIVDAVKALVAASTRTEEVVAAVRKQLEAKAAARAEPARVAPGARLRTGSEPAVPAGRRPGGEVPPAGRARPGRPAAPPPASRRTSRVLAASVLVASAAAALLILLPRLEPGTAPPPGASPGESGGRFAASRSPAPPSASPAPRWQREGAGPRPGFARLEAIEGPVYRHAADGTRRAAPELELAAGDWVSTSGSTARARVHGPGGSRIELAGDAVVGLSPDASGQAEARVFVASGRATAVVPAGTRGPTLLLASPHAIVSGTGTVRIDVASALTRVEVREGRARVSALGVQRGTDVEAGQLALVSAEELQPPRAQTAREALLLVGPDDTKEEPPPPEGLRGSEERLKVRLERLGFQVSVVDAGTLSLEQARAVSLIVLSSSVATKQLRVWFAELAVPMLVLESTGFEQLGLTGTRWRRDVGPAPPLAEILIQDPSHPLAGGLSGNVRVFASALNMRWAAPPATATVIATYPGARELAALMFAYERGSPTAAGTAGARRVGLSFMGNGRVIRALTENGWRLFDAAALWCADR